MIVGLGVDLLENDRVERELGRGAWFANDGVFTDSEVRQCAGGRSAARRYAACFAAKEATLKALGVAASDLAMFREVEVVLTQGVGTIVLHDRLRSHAERLGVRSIRLSVAPAKKLTGALVILEA